MDFVWFVIRPERAVAPADRAEAFECGFAEGWEGDADGFAVTCCTLVGLLWGRHCRYDTAWSPMRWKVEALRCATRSEWEVSQSPRTLRKIVLGKMSSAANGTLIVSALRDATYSMTVNFDVTVSQDFLRR